MVGAMHLVDTPLGAWLLLIALFVLGSFFGSFANVVIYRLPLGQSLLWPGSHCPACGHPIRWYDNVPVFGWLTLNGRCRDCHAPISVRYPLVESLFGVLLAALGWLEIIDSRSNLPNSSVADGTSPASDWAQVGYHLLLLGTLIVAALIEHDGRRIPRRLLLFTLLLGIALPLAWSGLRPVPLGVELPAGVEGQDAWPVLLEGLAGIGAAALLGCLAWPSLGQVAGRRWPDAAVLALATLGALLGWQAVCGIAVVASLCDLLAALAARTWPWAGRIGWATWLAGATAGWLACWSTLVLKIPALKGGKLELAVAAGAIVAMASVADWRVRRSTSNRRAADE